MRLVEAINECISENRRFFGVEFFPPKSEAAVVNLYDRMQRLMGQFSPLFCAMTSDESTAAQSIEIAATAQQVMNANMQVNITGGDCSKEALKERLLELRRRGIQNLCLVRGDSPGEDFPYAVDLVTFVRKEFGDYFGIAVAGYPEGHSETDDFDVGMTHLKAKVDAGADLIITQMIFDAQVFLDFCAACRKRGIKCPILPGVMPVHSYVQFSRRLRRFKGTDSLATLLDSVKNDDAEVQRVAAAWMTQMVKQLFRNGVRGIYVYSMNLETPVARLIEGTALATRVRTDPSAPVPAHWRNQRTEEEVRPIFWAGRPNSYLARTAQWDEFPNGRWSSEKSPAFRNDTTYHTQLAVGAHARQCTRFRLISSLEDVCASFLGFLDGNGKLPWAEDELSSEAGVLMEDVLKPLNARALLTINSQPAVNGAGSGNKIVGWGPSGGYVYQKQYLEFFVSPSILPTVVEVFTKHPSLSYMGQNSSGSTTVSSPDVGYTVDTKNDTKDSVTALTWGVFPGREILQPTVVSMTAFRAWTEEAFSLWLAPFDRGVAIPPIIQEIRDSWILLNVVDNDYIRRPTPLTAAVQELCQKLPLVVPLDTMVTGASSPALLGKAGALGKLLGHASYADLVEVSMSQQ